MTANHKVIAISPAMSGTINTPSYVREGVERLEYPAQWCSMIVRVMCALIFLLVLWTIIARIDIVANAKGRLIPTGDVKIVQPPADGTVLRLYVKEGQQVRRGQKLLLMDRAPLAANLEQKRRQSELLKNELARHQSAKKALSIAICDPSKLPSEQLDIATVGNVITDLYSACKLMHESKFDSATSSGVVPDALSDRESLKRKQLSLQEQRKHLESSIADKKRQFDVREQEARAVIQESIKMCAQQEKRRASLTSSLAKTKEQVACFEAVYKAGAISKIDYLTSMKQLDQEEANLIDIDGKLLEAKHNIVAQKLHLAEGKASMDALMQQSRSEVKRVGVEISNAQMQVREIDRKLNLSSSEFRAALARARAALQKESDECLDCEHKLKAVDAEIVSAQHDYDRAEICAPVQGLVTAIKAKSIGQVVARGQELMTIVPSSTALMMEVRVANKDFGFVKLKQKTKLKIDAYPYQDYGVINGTISEIEGQPQHDKDLGSYFNVRIVPDRNWVTEKNDRKLYLTNGMVGEADIVIRNKSIFEVMIEPITKLRDASIRG